MKELKTFKTIMNKGKFLLISLAAILMASCAKDNVDQSTPVAENAAISKKLINTSVEAEKGKLIIYVEDECAARLETAEVTRSGMTELDYLAEELGATSIKPVFNLKVNAERKRAMGMDRWFVVNFPEQVSLDAAAEKLAAIDYIEAVQFSTKVKRPTAMPVEVAPVAQTRADEYPFNDPGMYYQWHYINKGYVTLYPTSVAGEDINVEPAWKYTSGRPEIVVAVMDEGVCYTHEDLKDNMRANEAELNGVDGVDDDENGYVDDIYGYNFATNGRVSWGRDGDSGHGTHVAGTVAAVNNNGIGVVGVAGGSGSGDGVRIFSAQIFSGKQTAGYDATAQAAEYAADNGACILQCSWGFEPNAFSGDNMFIQGIAGVEYKAFQYFIETKNCDALDGGLVIFAAGNEGQPVAGYPGAYNDYIAVTAYAPDGLPAYYTCYDKGCNVSAPGGEYYLVGNSWAETGCVYSTLPNNTYGYMQGTSMACPHVSGIAALGLSYALDLGKTYTVDQFKSLILTSVNSFDEDRFADFKANPEGGTLNLASYRGKMGTGKIDAYRLFMGIRGVSCVPVSTTESNTIDFNAFIGDGKVSMKMLDYEISDETREALGITYDAAFGGKLALECTKPGAGTITVGFVAGGKNVGGGMVTGGMRIEKEFAIVARPGVKLDENGQPQIPGGWL